MPQTPTPFRRILGLMMLLPGVWLGYVIYQSQQDPLSPEQRAIVDAFQASQSATAEPLPGVNVVQLQRAPDMMLDLLTTIAPQDLQDPETWVDAQLCERVSGEGWPDWSSSTPRGGRYTQPVDGELCVGVDHSGENLVGAPLVFTPMGDGIMAMNREAMEAMGMSEEAIQQKIDEAPPTKSDVVFYIKFYPDTHPGLYAQYDFVFHGYEWQKGSVQPSRDLGHGEGGMVIDSTLINSMMFNEFRTNIYDFLKKTEIEEDQ